MDIIINPKRHDLVLVGDFLKLEVHATSFSVYYQLYMGSDFAMSYEIIQKIFPLKFLPDFFKANSTVSLFSYCPRIAYPEPVVKINGKEKAFE